MFSFTRQLAAWHCPHLPLLLSAAAQQPTDISCPPGAHAAQQQTRIGGVLIMGRTDGRTDRRTLDRYSDPAPRAMRAVPKIAENATQNVLHRWDKKTARCWDGCINQHGGFSRNPEVVFGTSCSLQYVSTCQLLFFLIRSTSNKTVFFLNKCQSYLFK